ncbi:hypothetical protein RD792_017595 [Penstemon davidsonii]|uniref:LOB domain-containing protein n=1 Tax=Penstemon davidsonii TaxID=160366 RepID=A0ABR0CMG2_9LAMI|nr:hypothetical protein RD792_017595 [Penstemon davidsonii]
MSCNGCRVLRRGCSEQCILRPCLEWIESPQAQGNATLFLSKFFGRSDLMSFISAATENKRPALFQSLLFEACGRTVNPVNGAVGLLSTGNWHICQAAVDTVLAGGVPQPISDGVLPQNAAVSSKYNQVMHESNGVVDFMVETASLGSGISEVSKGGKEPKLLNLFLPNH